MVRFNKAFSYPAKSGLESFRAAGHGSRATRKWGLSQETIQVIKAALKEDIGAGDITSNLLIPRLARGKAKIISKSTGVFSGAAAAQTICKTTGVRLRLFVKDGSALKKNQKIAELSGNIRAILKTERVLLNLIGHFSGIATQTGKFVRAVQGTRCCILDTRKTTPLWRELEKAAVRAGGGFNHRFGLFDYILVKENHRKFGKLSKLGRSKSVKSRSSGLQPLGFEVEVRNFDELIEAFDLGAGVVMLDHFSQQQAKRAVKLRNQLSPQTLIEASGNMTVQTVCSYAKAGVDAISVGVLTHSVPAHDFSLLVK